MLLEVNKLSFGYDRKEIVRNLSFTVEKGDYLCVIGENGAGKTTLIKVLLNLKKPYSGTINFSDGLTQHEIGYLPQHTSVQKDFPATVREIVLSGCLGRLGKKFFYDEEEGLYELVYLDRGDTCQDFYGKTKKEIIQP